MQNGRRLFLSMIVLPLAEVRMMFAGQMGGSHFPHVPHVPDASDSGSVNDEPVSPKRNSKEQLKENQKNLQRDADHLLQLAQELKDEADKTTQTDVLSLSLVRKAEEVEKLAKQIKGLARAN